jgi:hypothetical protein
MNDRVSATGFAAHRVLTDDREQVARRSRSG